MCLKNDIYIKWREHFEHIVLENDSQVLLLVYEVHVAAYKYCKFDYSLALDIG